MLNEALDAVPQIGRLEWIGLSSATRSEITEVEEAAVQPGTGLDGDYHSTRRPGGKRQVTLIQSEHFPVVTAILGRPVHARETRRNLVVAGINLASLKKARFRIGAVELEGTGECAPCSRMEENLGAGGFQAMRGHGGITARVLTGGTIRLGDPVEFLENMSAVADSQE